MHLCMKHRFDDLHNCKPVVDSDKYQRIKKTAFGFNWNTGKDPKKPAQQRRREESPSIGDRILRFFMCCGCGGNNNQSKEDKNKAQSRPPPERQNKNAANLQKFEDPPMDQMKCPLCHEVFEDANMLLFHTNEVHREMDAEIVKISKEPVRIEQKVETEKCPKCFKRFSIAELPIHIEQEHFM